MKRNYYGRTIVPILTVVILTLLCITGCPRQPGREVPTDGTTSTTTTTQKNQVVSFPQTITGLTQPVAMVFVPDGRIFITERTGQIRIFENGQLRKEPFATVSVPQLAGYHETGLLGIARPQNFNALPYVYVYHTYQKGNSLLNRVVRFRVTPTGTPTPEVIIDNIPGGRIHDGGIIAFGPDGNLYIATGDSGNSSLAQNLNSTGGKILRLGPDGSIPPDNPFPDSPVYSYGHRNIFGIAFQPGTGALYVTENGPAGDDEVNKIEAGKNYGWPTVTGESGNARFVDPVITYSRTVAPTQAIFYTGNLIPSIKNRFVFGTYVTDELHALEFSGPGGTQVRSDNVIFRSDQPIIGVAQSPDGGIYIIGTSLIRKIVQVGS